jgi:hypothetical protein
VVDLEGHLIDTSMNNRSPSWPAHSPFTRTAFSPSFLYWSFSFPVSADLSETDRGEKLIRNIMKRLSLYLLIFFVSGFPGRHMILITPVQQKSKL